MLNTFTHHNIRFSQCTLLDRFIYSYVYHSRDVHFFFNLPSFFFQVRHGDRIKLNVQCKHFLIHKPVE